MLGAGNHKQHHRNLGPNLLMVAFHYPPYSVSSGVQRAAKFAKYLPQYGIAPMVLTAKPFAYGVKADGGKGSDDGFVFRSFALDTVTHLGVKGRYPGFLALPDRWISWFPAAVVSGKRLIRKHRPLAVWSTYPIATTHIVAIALQRISGLPWVADFRDPMVDEVHPQGKAKRRLFTWIEQTVLQRADSICFTTPGAAAMYRERYPEVREGRICTISNGFDEEDFISMRAPARNSDEARRRVLLHSGTIYPLERDPTSLIKAIAQLKEKKLIVADRLKVVLRATGHDAFVRALLLNYQVGDIVEIAPGLQYSDALREMCEVDGLLLLQAGNCNNQIPAKAYEYLRAARPIFTLADPTGDTAALMRSVGMTCISPIDNPVQIERGLMTFLSQLDKPSLPLPQHELITRFSRRHQAGELAEIVKSLGRNRLPKGMSKI